jgi:hypothetical protein
VQALSARPPAHTTLASFLRYAADLPLDRASSVFRGTLFEYSVLECLKRHSFDVYRTGGADDKGIDLRGHWTLPVLTTNSQDGEESNSSEKRIKRTRQIPVVVQCKHEIKKLGPRVVREVGGIRTFVSTVEERPSETLRVLASSSMFTEKAIQAMMTSTSALLLCLIDPPGSISNTAKTVPLRGAAKKPDNHNESETVGQLRQVIWNSAAASIIGPELKVRLVYPAGDKSSESGEPALKLFFGGQALSKRA